MSEQSNVTDLPLAPNLQDQLGLSNYTRALCSFVKSAKTPMTIAVQGEWGCGKTSLMNSLFAHCCCNFKFSPHFNEKHQTNVLDENEVRPYLGVWINTWQYSMLKNDSDAQVAVIKGVAREMNAQMDMLLGSSTAKEIGRKLMISLGGIALTAARVGIHSIGLNPQSLDDIKEARESEQDGPDYVRRKFKESVESYISEYNERQRDRDKVKGFIFFIDDLDRLDPPVAVQILSLLKNLFEAEHCIFILAIDYEVVVEGLESRFGKKTESNEREFRSFFDKIIQLSFRVPIESYRIDTFLKSLLTEIKFFKDAKTLDNEEFLSDITNLVLNSCGKNPRSIKRMVNTLSLVKKLHEFNPTRLEQEYPETFSKLLIGIVCVQSAYPRIYEELLKRQNLFGWLDSNINPPQSLTEVRAEIEEVGPENFFLGDSVLTDPWVKKKSRNVQNLLNRLFHLCMQIKLKDEELKINLESNLRTTKDVLSQVLQASKLTFAEPEQELDFSFETFEEFVDYWTSPERQSERVENKWISELSDFCEIFNRMVKVLDAVAIKYINNEIRFFVNKNSGAQQQIIFWIKVVPTGFIIQRGYSKLYVGERTEGVKYARHANSLRLCSLLQPIEEKLWSCLGRDNVISWHDAEVEFYQIEYWHPDYEQDKAGENLSSDVGSQEKDDEK